MADNDSTVYRVTWWPTDDAPASMAGRNQTRRHTDVKIIEGYSTFEDIRKIIAVTRSGSANNAQFVHVFAAVQIEGAM